MAAETKGNHTTYTNLFLGTVQWQNLTMASLTNKIVYGASLAEGIMMILGNSLLIMVIFLYKPLRRKEMIIVAGLAAGDLLYGVGYFFAGIRRLSLALEGKHLWKITPWSCMKAMQTSFFIAGSQAGAFMLVILSIDRLLAVKFFAFYMGLGARYAKVVLLSVFSYCIFTVLVATGLSAFASDPNPTIIAICLSTQIGPGWFSSYQPTIQMGSGILSVVIYILTWYFYKCQLLNMPQNVQNQQMEKQRKLTRTVGITVMFTFFCYVLPHGMIFFFNSLQASKQLAGVMSPFGFVISNVNSIVNIFIVGVHNQDVRGVLQAWMKCSKPQFAGGHTISQPKTHSTPGTNPRNRFRNHQIDPGPSRNNQSPFIGVQSNANHISSVAGSKVIHVQNPGYSGDPINNLQIIPDDS